MADFVVGGDLFGPYQSKNNYLRSTDPRPRTDSRTVSKDTIPSRTFEGVSGLKILNAGTVLAAITNGPNSGKFGPFQAVGTPEVQTLTESGTISGGTYTLSFNGETTAALNFDATAATVEAALEALTGIGTDNIVVTGGPVHTTPLTITFQGELSGNQSQITANVGSLTGTTPGITAATSTPGVAGAIDGRGVLTNIVGINDTQLPWQLMERDVEVANVYEAAVVQAWCIELDASGAEIVLTNTTAAAMFAKKDLDIRFK